MRDYVWCVVGAVGGGFIAGVVAYRMGWNAGRRSLRRMLENAGSRFGRES